MSLKTLFVLLCVERDFYITTHKIFLYSLLTKNDRFVCALIEPECGSRIISLKKLFVLTCVWRTLQSHYYLMV